MGRSSLHPGLLGRVLPAVLILATLLWSAVAVGHGHLGRPHGACGPDLSASSAAAVAAPCPLCRLDLKTVCAANPDDAVSRIRPVRVAADHTPPPATAEPATGARVPRGPPSPTG